MDIIQRHNSEFGNFIDTVESVAFFNFGRIGETRIRNGQPISDAWFDKTPFERIHVFDKWDVAMIYANDKLHFFGGFG